MSLIRFLVIKEENNSQNYIGVPYRTEREAKTSAINDFYNTCPTFNHFENHKMNVYYFNNETHLVFTSEETGEILCEYFILIVSF